MEDNQKIKNIIELPHDQAISYLEIQQNEAKHYLKKDICTPCSQQPYLEYLRHGDNLSVHQQMNEVIYRYTYICNKCIKNM